MKRYKVMSGICLLVSDIEQPFPFNQIINVNLIESRRM